MVRILIFAFLLSLFHVTINAQTIGQTKAYIIKNYETCKITKNLPDYLTLDCDGLEVLFIFDEDGLCIIHGSELTLSDWNNIQVTLVWNNASCASKSTAPALISQIKSNVVIYTQGGKDYFFYECDFQGNKDEGVKSVALRKHE